MSRGGRGGARGGLKGASWDVDTTLQLNSKPSELFPHYELSRQRPPAETELRQVRYYRTLRDRMHQSSIYTRPRKRNPGEAKKIYGEEQDNERYAARVKAEFDPFTGVPTYSMKYEQKQRDIPQLSGPFDKSLFPKELWYVLEGEDGEAVRKIVNKSIRRKAELMARADPHAHLTPSQRKDLLDQKLKDIEEGDLDEDAVKDDEEQQEEEEDVDYELDEAEMGGDYDAEQYFDGGDDDDDGDADGGGGGGDDY